MGAGEIVFSARAIAAGLLVGSLLCFSNMYFGLQTGWVTMASMQAAILGYGLFRVLNQMQRAKQLSLAETVLIQTTAVATATMPLAAGLVGVVPALGMMTAEENPPDGPIVLSFGQLLAWSLGLAFIGVFAAPPLRVQTILREKLRFPSGAATASVIRTLHRIPWPNPDAKPVAADLSHHGGMAAAAAEDGVMRNGDGGKDDDEAGGGLLGGFSDGEDDERMPLTGGGRGSLPSALSIESMDNDQVYRTARGSRVEEGDDGWGEAALVPGGLSEGGGASSSSSSSSSESGWRASWRCLLWSLAASGAYTLLAGWAPALKSLPVMTWLGWPAATAWGWELAPAMGYVGQGMIMGPRTAFSMLAGALLGYAVLGPMARSRGWAPGPIHDWQHGAAGWIMWVALAIMLADSLMSFSLLLGKNLIQRRQGSSSAAASVPCDSHKRRHSDAVEFLAAAVGGSRQGSVGGVVEEERGDVPRTWWLSGLVASWALCTAVMSPLFGLPLHQPLVAVALALVVAVVAVRALGETDLNPVSGVGKVSQILFAVIAPGQVVPNLVAGAIAEAGAQQAGDLMQDFKTAHLLGVSPRAQFVAMLIGSAASVPISVAAYCLYNSAWQIPGPEFAVPSAQIWLDMARLVNGGSLPTGVAPFCVAAAALAALLVAANAAITAVLPRIAALGLSARSGDGGLAPYRRAYAPLRLLLWAIRHLVPSGVALAVGMYISPKWTLPRVIGSAAELTWRRLSPRTHRSLMLVTASGMVLGEGTASIFLALEKAVLG